MNKLSILLIIALCATACFGSNHHRRSKSQKQLARNQAPVASHAKKIVAVHSRVRLLKVNVHKKKVHRIKKVKATKAKRVVAKKLAVHKKAKRVRNFKKVVKARKHKKFVKKAKNVMKKKLA